MITFRYKSNTKQIKIKSKRDLNERMSPWLQGIFSIKNPIVGFRVANNKYYDTETFYNNKEKFYGQVIDIIEAKDQLEISFVSDNLNSSSNIRNPNLIHPEDFQDEAEESYKIVTDIKSMERKMQDNKELNIVFHIHQIYKNQIVESINLIKSQPGLRANFNVRILQPKSPEIPSYSIYVGKKLIGTLNLTREYKENIQMVIERYTKKMQKTEAEKEKNSRQQEKDQQFRMSYEQENEAPSFTTYQHQLQERLNQQACQDYLLKMYQEKMLKKYEYLKLNEKCEDNFADFYRIFCEGAMDNDYDNFKNQIRAKVDNNLEILLSNVDEMDLSRPISREEQRKQNLKKSVSNIEIVKVENYFEILDQLKHLLMPITISLVKSELLGENEIIFDSFSDFLSRKITKQDLAATLEKAVQKKQKRPISRCIPRSANRTRQPAYYSEDEILNLVPSNMVQSNQNQTQNQNKNQNTNTNTNTNTNVIIQTNVLKRSSFSNKDQPIQKEQAQQIKLMSLGSGSGSKQVNRVQAKETPPMFGSSKQENNFSPIKYMSDIESNYKQAWTRLESKADFFEPEEYGLLYYYLESRDDSISNHIQELEYNEQSSLDRLKHFLENRMIEILKQNFSSYELDAIIGNRQSQKIKCIYENFRYESDLAKFLQSLREQAQLIQSITASPSPTLSYQPPATTKPQVLHKKSSDGNLLAKHKKQPRKYSGQNKQIHSPRQSSFSHGKSNEASAVYLENMNSFWGEEFQEMLDHCNFSEEHKEEYLRNAFKQGNPSVYAWINNFLQGKLGIIDVQELKCSMRVRDQENRYIMKVVPIFSEILRCFQEDGQISDKMRKWCVVQLMQLNMSILGAFQAYIKTKNHQQFLDTITLSYQLQNSEMQYYRNYLCRIQCIIKQLSPRDEIGLQIFRLYPKHIKSICQVFLITGDICELLDSLDCMHRLEINRRKFKMATLNFSGINLNPFEYYDGTNDLEEISGFMKQILETEKCIFDTKLGIIDKYFQNNLMSVRFGTKVCENQYLPDFPEFSKQWNEFYRNNRPQNSKQASQQTAQCLMLFDYYCYLSTIRLVYQKQWKTTPYNGPQKKIQKQYQIQGINKLQSKPLQTYIQGKLNRPASKLQKKYQLTMDYFLNNDLDILFLQEADGVAWEDQLVHQFGWVKGGASVIIFRKDKLGQPKFSLIDKYKDKLNFNNDSAFYFGDRGYLLLSVHLRSNPDVNIGQAQEMFKQLEEILEAHPMLKIIIGMDANFFIGGSQHNFLNFAPKLKEEFTTNKMRTFVQVQFSKSDVLAKSGKDYILSNLNIKNYVIEKINGEAAKQTDLLPSYDHPYDHFIIKATI